KFVQGLNFGSPAYFFHFFTAFLGMSKNELRFTTPSFCQYRSSIAFASGIFLARARKMNFLSFSVNPMATLYPNGVSTGVLGILSAPLLLAIGYRLRNAQELLRSRKQFFHHLVEQVGLHRISRRPRRDRPHSICGMREHRGQYAFSTAIQRRRRIPWRSQRRRSRCPNQGSRR